MSRRSATLAIVFADISGSTRLYETLGDAVARELVSQCLDLMTQQITKHGGTVIKTIGDEIMCTFATGDEAVESAMAMQEVVTEDLPRINPNMPSSMTIRIGLHFGPAILEQGDVFGDAVNTAARMAGLRLALDGAEVQPRASPRAGRSSPPARRPRGCHRRCVPARDTWTASPSRARRTSSTSSR